MREMGEGGVGVGERCEMEEHQRHREKFESRGGGKQLQAARPEEELIAAIGVGGGSRFGTLRSGRRRCRSRRA